MLQMKHRLSFIILAGLLALSCNQIPRYDEELKDSLVHLDRILDKKEELAAQKEFRIDSLRILCGQAPDSRSLYLAYDALFREYHKWDVDSAYRYAYAKFDLARVIGSQEMITASELDLACRYFLSSHYQDAIAMMEAIDTSVVASLDRLSEYRYLWYDIYHGLVQTSSHGKQFPAYRQAEQAYLDLCDKFIKSDCIEFYVTQAKVLIPKGRHDEIISLITGKLSDSSTSIEDKARLHYWVGRAYNAKGDERNAMIHYATSTTYDFRVPLKTYGSAFSLARLCFNRGDIRRAYRYIMHSYTNAMDMEDNMHITRIAELLPRIITQHEQYVSRNRRVMGVMIISLIILLLMLSFAMSLLQRNLKRLDIANSEKEVFLSEFMSMFSEHIDGLERYRSSLRVVSKQMDFDAILQELRSDDFIDSEWKYLHEKFDQTILGLLPNFVDNINSLLRADSQLGKDLPRGKLSNELRVLALMRLGVSEPARISKFLRLSPSTVYNYRVKFRNAAACSREEFESRIMNIGE